MSRFLWFSVYIHVGSFTTIWALSPPWGPLVSRFGVVCVGSDGSAERWRK